MTDFDEGLWARLVDEHDAHHIALEAGPGQITKRPLLLGGSVTALAGIVTVAVLAINATSAPPAYALTKNADGSVTVTINDLATAIPELNARFAKMGIDETVVPARADCASSANALQLFAYPGEKVTDTLTFVPGRRYLAPGFTGVVAAEQLPGGEVAMAVGAVKPPVPNCFSSIVYNPRTMGALKGTPTVTATPVQPSPMP
jgi:hypothetical protein